MSRPGPDRHDRSMTKSSARAARLATAGLLVLSAVPIIAGASRVAAIAGGRPVTPENARFVEIPVPVVVHIIGATLFCVLGAFQFHRGFRRRRPGWHRIVGRILVPSGIIAALSGIWMTLYYPLPAHDGARFGILGIERLFFGTLMAAAIVISFRAILKRDIVRHRAMIRGYAIGMGAGTQVLTILPWVAVVGPPGALAKALLMGAAWLINVAFAEWIIRRRPRRRGAATRRTGVPVARKAPNAVTTAAPDPAR
jgi:hypothetical protein